MKYFIQRILLPFFSTIIISGCISSAAQVSSAPLPFILVTAASNPSPTPTPFQPAGEILPGAIELFVPQQVLATETPSPNAIPISNSSPTPTPEANLLFPTIAAPPVVEPAANVPTALPALTEKETINFLLIGTDQRSGSSFRTDTMVIAIVWPKNGQVSLISIPRDLWVYIPEVGMQRINTAFQSGELMEYPGGGEGLLKDTITYNLGVTIDHTAMVDFDGFRRVVDTLGGVELPIACAYTDWRLIDPSYDPEDENNWWLYTVGPGQVHMDGDLALWYARSRSKSNDFDRGRRQQETIRAIFAKALQTNTFGKIPQLYSDFSSTVVTDLGLGDLLLMAPYAVNFTNANIRGYYIRPPYVNEWTTPGGAAVLLPSEADLAKMLLEATSLSQFAVERKAVMVEVQNGTSVDSLDNLAATRLNYAGYQSSISNADRRDYSNSVIMDFTPAQDATQRETIIAALNLYSTSVISSPDANSRVQYRVILGYDYDPCFKPQDLSH